MATDPGSADADASTARGWRRGTVGLAAGTLADGSRQSGTAAARPRLSARALGGLHPDYREDHVHARRIHAVVAAVAAAVLVLSVTPAFAQADTLASVGSAPSPKEQNK